MTAATDRIKDAFVEQMKQLAAEGHDLGDIGGIAIGLASGWVCAHGGKEKALAALAGARLAVEQHGATLN